MGEVASLPKMFLAFTDLAPPINKGDTKMKKEPKSVLVAGKLFPSIYSAAKFYNAQAASFLWALNHSKKWHGITIEYATESKNPKKYTTSCPVLCETTGILYDSISQAARAAHTNMWTMSVKMTTSGKFIDRNGNVYIRQKPMVSKNTYKNTGSTVLSRRSHYKRTKSEPIDLGLPDTTESILGTTPMKTSLIAPKSDEEMACYYIKRLIHQAIDKDDYKKVDTYLTMIEELGGK